MNLSLPQFGINVLNVFDGRKVIAAFSVLWRFERFDKQCLERRNESCKGRIERGFAEISILRYIKKTKPRKTVPSATQPVNGMFVQWLPQRAVNCSPYVHDRVMIIENVNALLLPEIYRLREGLLFAKDLQIIAPDNKIALPVHAKRVND